MKTLYCWRCRDDRPMLERHELRIVQRDMRRAAKNPPPTWRSTDPDVPWPEYRAALDAYARITGVSETVFAAIFHHLVWIYGPPCHRCGRPLRTPQASLCGSCMAPRQPVDAPPKAGPRQAQTRGAVARPG